MNAEIWRPVVGMERFYRVSNYGRLKATFEGNHGQFKPGRAINAWRQNNEYKMFRPWNPELKKFGKHKAVHAAVLEAFVGPRPPGAVSRHLDGDRTNNIVSNLAWGTCKQNYDDSRIHGTNCQGVRNGSSKLTEKDVIKIRRLRKTGLTYKEIGLRFNTHWSNVLMITKLKTWKHVKKA